jgi:hypothetical protein
MCYKCQACFSEVPPRRPMLRHTVYRSNADGPSCPKGSVLREVPVCEDCYLELMNGTRLADLASLYVPKAQSLNKLVLPPAPPLHLLKPVQPRPEPRPERDPYLEALQEEEEVPVIESPKAPSTKKRRSR